MSASSDMSPSVAVDFNGNAVLVFEHDSNIWFSKYTYAQNSWSGPSAIASGAYASPQVAVDGTAKFTAVWRQAMGAATTGVWQATSSDGVNWMLGTQPLATNLAEPPVLSVNSAGAAVVAWSEKIANGNEQQAIARIRDTQGNWLPSQTLHAAGDVNKRYPAAVMSSIGEAFVVWEQTFGNWNSIWYRRFTGGQWDAETQLETDDTLPSYAPAIATNSHGVVIVTYLQLLSLNPASVQLLSRRYAGAGWDGPNVVGGAPGIDNIPPPSITLDDNGVATAAWNAANPAGIYNVHVNMTLASTGNWAPSPTAAETDDMATFDNFGGSNIAGSTQPVVRGDGAGHVFLVWRKRVAGGRFDVFASHYIAGQWEPTMIESRDVNSAFYPALGVNGSSVAVAAWFYGTELDVYANVWR
jgi:hypothetical protein